MSDTDIPDALARLDALTRRLRRECPWDREQDERSIVPHTLEEAYELADAAHARDDVKLLDELGDVLFQVHFLALLLEERGAGDLGEVADHCAEKLIRRHPHVFGEAEVADAAEVLRNWDQIKSTEPGRERGVFGEVPKNLPALLYARKLQRRAAAAARASGGGAAADSGMAIGTLRDELAALETAIAGESTSQLAVGSSEIADRSAGEPSEGESARPRAFEELGDVLFAVVSLARELKLDPELALRAAAQRFREKALEEIGEQ